MPVCALLQENNVLTLKVNYNRERERAGEFTGCEDGEDQPAVFGSRVSVQSAPMASFSNQRLNGCLAWITAGAALKWWRSVSLTHSLAHTYADIHTEVLWDINCLWSLEENVISQRQLSSRLLFAHGG